jgi:hypothetical protein
MDEAIIFTKSAFKHGVTEANIRRAFEDFIYEIPAENAENKYLLLGFDRNANLLEIGYNRIDADTIKVFHAMPCRPGWRKFGKI